jgi:FKBP-type peptidyl-prolyl cis-trans isomerase FklB
MKKSTLAILSTVILSLFCVGSATAQTGDTNKLPDAPAAKTQTASPSPFKTEKEKASYALGMNIANGTKRQSIEIDPDILAQGMKDFMAGKTLMTDEEAIETLHQLQNEVQAKMEAERQEQGAANQKEGDTFLAANKAKEGVVALPSGLQYKVITQGTGPKPTASDTVVCNYKGTLINGTVFDSSEKHGHPLTFPVNGVIKGWTEALQLMPVGSKWQLFIPASLAYGERGAGADIPPNSTLIFDVELLSIQAKDNPAKGAPPSK